MKKNILNISIIVLLVNAMILGSCVKPEDLVTADAKTGGLVDAMYANIPFKLGETVNVDVSINVLKGPAINSVEVYKVFYTVDGDESNKVLAGSINVNGGNTSEDISASLSLTYEQLRDGLTVNGSPLPADENQLNIADYWMFTFESILADGRTVVNNATTNIAVANFFAGSYAVTGYFYHPTAPREIDEDKDLVAINSNTCSTTYGDFQDPTWLVEISIDKETSVVTLGFPDDEYGAFQGDPNDASHTCTYDPATGVIELWYSYMGGSGWRISHEIYTPL